MLTPSFAPAVAQPEVTLTRFWWVKGFLERLLLPVTLQYDFTSPNARMSRQGSWVMIALWMVLELATPFILFGSMVWFEMLGAVGSLAVALWMPFMLSSAVAGLQICRALVGLVIASLAQFGLLSVDTANWSMVIWQIWILAATLMLILVYVRTPKKDMPKIEKTHAGRD